MVLLPVSSPLTSQQCILNKIPLNGLAQKTILYINRLLENVVTRGLQGPNSVFPNSVLRNGLVFNSVLWCLYNITAVNAENHLYRRRKV